MVTLLLAVCALAGVGVWPPEHGGSAAGPGLDLPPLRFRDRTPDTPLAGFQGAVGGPEQWSLLEQNGQGVALFDADGDGDLDIFLPRGAARLEQAGAGASAEAQGTADGYFENLGAWHFADRSAGSGLAAPGWSVGAAAADYDGDGDVDLYVTRWGGDRLYANRGDGVFRDVTAQAGIRAEGYTSSAAFFDADGDGDLDLYVGRYVVFDPLDVPRTENHAPCTYRGVVTGCGPWVWPAETDLFFVNDGHGRFHDASAAWGVTEAGAYRSLAVVPVDLDGDGRLDLAVGADVMPNLLLFNHGTGFHPAAGGAGFALNAAGEHESGMGVAILDYDGDGDPDLAAVNFQGQTHTLYENREGVLRDVTAQAAAGDFGRDRLSWGTAAVDLDGDGRPELTVASGHIYPQVEDLHDPADRYVQDIQVWSCTPHGQLVQRALEGVPAASFRGLAAGDLDGDGDPDLVAVRHGGPPLLLENLNPPAGAMTALRVVGPSPNTAGLGARVRLRAAESNGEAGETGPAAHTYWVLPHQGYQSSHDPRVFVPALTPDGDPWLLEVRWPDGAERVYEGLPAGGLLRR